MKKKCLFSLLTSSHIVGFKVFCKSLIKNNPWILDVELDLIIISIDLSKQEKEYCESLYPFIKWKEKNAIPEHFYEGDVKIGECAFHKLSAFSIYDYDLVVSIDCSDMVIVKHIGDLFSYDPDIGMVQGWTPVAKWQQYNGGLVLLNKKYRNKETYNKLIKSPPSRLYDQDIINKVFKKTITRLPVKFNFSKRMIQCKEVSIADAAIIHYVGDKPWENYKEQNKYKQIESVWHEYS